MSRKEAQLAGRRFYTGSVCAKHPDELGRRYAVQGTCPGCNCERKRREYQRSLPLYRRLQ